MATIRRCRRRITAIRGASSVAIAVALIAAIGASVRAQEAPPPEETPPAAQPDPGDAQALALYEQGDRRYAEGRYEEAIELFEKAYALSPRPLLLYNMANTFERMGEYQRAADALERYIKSGDAADVDTLGQRLRQIQNRAAERAGEMSELESLRQRPESCPAQVACPLRPHDTDNSDRWAYVLLATGGAALVSTAIFGVMARSAGSDARAKCVNGPGGRLCSSDAQADLDREQRFALVTDVSAVVGVAALGTGAYLYWRYRNHGKRDRDATALLPTLLPGGAGVTVHASF